MNYQDAKPFVDLYKDVEELKEKIDGDIKKCAEFLDSKIADLISDSEFIDRGVRSTTSAVFSKAKYDIFISVKTLINEVEKEWLKYISEMKKLFVENVEIFLANTKLQVTFPSNENQTSPKKSPIERRLSSVTGTIYPIINTIAQNIPGIGASFQNKSQDVPKKSAVENTSQFNRGSRFNTSFSSVFDTSSDLEEKSVKTASNIKKGRSSIICMQLPRKQNESTSNTSSEFEDYLVEDPGYLNTRESFSTSSIKLSDNLIFGQSASKYSEKFGHERVIINKDERVEEAVRGKASAVATRGKKTSSRNAIKHSYVVEDNEMTKADTEEEMEIEMSLPQVATKGRRGRVAANKNTNTSAKDLQIGRNPRGRVAAKKPDIDKEPEVTVPVNDVVENGTISSMRSRRGPSKAGKKGAKEESVEKSLPISPKKVSFQEDQLDDLDELPAKPAKSLGRRKTVMPSNLNETLSDLSIDVSRSRTKGKRKTIGGNSDLDSTLPPKRLRVGKNAKNISAQDEDRADDNLLEDGNYSDWISLKNADAKVPVQPGIYEVKVGRAKKPAYIGGCDNLRQKITLHKLQHNSGHKHLDKFIERNINDIQIRYEVMPSMNDAKAEEKKRVKHFVEQYKTTPAYN